MLLVNGTEIPTFDLDTTKSLITRIAVAFDSISKYIHFSEPFEYDPSENIELQAQDILNLIRADGSENTNVTVFIGSNKELFHGLNILEDVVKPWLAYNSAIERMVDSMGDIFLVSIGNTMTEQGYFSSSDAFQDFWENDRAGFRRNLEAMIEREKQEEDDTWKLYQMFQAISEGKPYTDFKIIEVLLKVFLKFPNSSILEVFNALHMDDSIPFASCKNYYKILKGYSPYEKWAKPSESLSLKVNSKINVNRTNFNDYLDIDLVPQGEDGMFTTNVTLIFESGYLERKKFLERLISPFEEPPTIETIDETEITALFYFPEFRIDSYVFSDLVMNDKVFSRLITIDESVKATKKKGEYGQPWLYIHFNHPSIGHVTASIGQKLVDRSDPEMKDQDLEIFEHGRPYIRVRATAANKEAMKKFQEVFSKLLVVYDDNYQSIVDSYQKFIPTFGTIYEEEVRLKKKTHELIAPKVFVKNYSRNCPEYRIPTIMDSDGVGIMKFPRDPTDHNPLPSDGVSQYYYGCTNPEYPYIGLQKNKLPENRDSYPYVPCCFKTEQTTKQGGYYRHYYFGDDLEVKEKKQQDLIITNKFLDNDKYGVLPDNLLKFFDLSDSDYEHKYIRVGVTRSPSSFLQCVMTALDEQTGIQREKDRLKKVLEIRRELTASNILPMARQCSYNFTLEDLEKKVSNPNEYFDPHLFIQLLEGYFGCNIFLFDSEGMTLPTFRQNYYRNASDHPCILVYEHWGSESDHATYPQCELIGKWKIDSKIPSQNLFAIDEPLALNVTDIFRLINNSYVLTQKVRDITFSIPEGIQVVSQQIDSYGKTRRLNCVVGQQKLTILTDPIPPLPIEENKTAPVSLCNINTCMKYFEPIEQTLQEGMLAEVISTIGNVRVIIPVEKQAPLEDIPICNESIHYIQTENTQDLLDKFNRNKKLARYIFEYAIWLFSSFIKSRNVTDKELATFAKEKILIDPEFQYKKVDKRFSLDSGVIKNGKLVLNTMEGLKRLMYMVKLYSMQDIKSLRTYYQKKFISQYYVDITDFDTHPNQVILQGEDSIDKWLQEKTFRYILANEVMVGKRAPYFFKNSLVADEILLAQNVDSLEMAYSIGYNWVKNGYNLSQAVEKVPIGSFTLYRYRNKDDIVVYNVQGESDRKVRILGYKISGAPFYTVLLDLSMK